MQNKQNHTIKGLILAGGYGSRFLPVTKTIPKEMLPLIDRPAIDFIVEEFVKSGIKQILIISSRRKKGLEDYFDREIELEGCLDGAKLDKINSIEQLYKDVKIYFIRQKEMKGTGHAVLLGNGFLDSPFVLAFPDDIIFSDIPLAQQLINVYNRTKLNVLSVKDCAGEDLSRYGIVEPSLADYDVDSIINIKGIIEKPVKGTEPSSLVSIGRYLLTPDIFPILEKGFNTCKDKEYFLTDALNELSHQKKVVAHHLRGKRYDTGEPLGYLKTITDYALMRDDLKDSYLSYLKEIISK